MAWYEKYMPVPFAEKGRDLTGLDCWGLVQHAYRENLGIELPSYEWVYQNTVKDAKDISATVVDQSSKLWLKVEKESVAPFDVIIMRMRGLPMHVGLVTRKSFMLHCVDGIGVSHESYDSLRWINRIVGFVRYANG